MIYPQQETPVVYVQPLQVQAQFFQEVGMAIMLALMAIWVIQQGIKAFHGEEIEKPF